jgi:hypothetical protein
MTEIDLMPILSSSPVTALACLVWWECRSLAKSMVEIRERMASLEAKIGAVSSPI